MTMTPKPTKQPTPLTDAARQTGSFFRAIECCENIERENAALLADNAALTRENEVLCQSNKVYERDFPRMSFEIGRLQGMLAGTPAAHVEATANVR